MRATRRSTRRLSVLPRRSPILVPLLLAALLAGLCATPARAQEPVAAAPVEAAAPTETAPATPPPAPPGALVAADTPSDNGGSITLTWTPSADDTDGRKIVTGYEVFRSTDPASGFESIGFSGPGTTGYRDSSAKDSARHPYYYKVAAVSPSGSGESAVAGPALESAQWFATKSWNLLLIALFLFGTILYYIDQGRRGRPPFVRRIAGLDALEEAIGRATEMGKPIIYIPGVHDMNEVQTVASMTILSHVAKKAATYDSRLLVPNRFSLVMTTARETVKESFLSVGRPDSYREDDIFYVSDEQFGFVAGASGLIVREKPAACLFFGSFYAESLILAETGNTIGAIQIAGTAQPAQLPFFVAACDYTLIGEELFAASAYLSGEPRQLGSLKGQDVGKLLAFAAIIGGTLLTTVATLTGSGALQTAFSALVRLFTAAE